LRARNLHGLYLFRAGKNDEARKVYLDLMSVHPNDMALRLNLSLVELRMGLNTEAAANLELVVKAEPENARALGYLGLALMREGELERARAIFVLAGQPDLARQVGEKLAELGGDAASAKMALRQAASAGSRALEKDQPFASVELEPPSEE